MQFTTGQRVGPYEVLSRVGSGGMGDVYAARDPRLDRRVALKVLRPRTSASDQDRRRLLREGRALARIVHPHVAAVYDVVDTGEAAVLVLEYVEGRTLRRVMEGGPLPPGRALAIAVQICEALEAAHAHGVVHGDIKPENVCLTATGHVKVLDFGIARVVARPDTEANGTLTTDSAIPGAFAGTPRYAAPELFTGAPADEQTDVYAVGAVFYEMLTGRPPHAGAHALEIGMNALAGAPARADALVPDIPAAVADEAARAVATDRRVRPASAAALAARLRTLPPVEGGTGEAPTLSHADVAAALAAHRPDDGPSSLRRLSSTLASTIVLAPRHRRRTAALALVALVLAGTGWFAWRAWPARAPALMTGGPPVLAILPLEAVGDDRRAAAIGLGVADALIADLAGTPGLVVVSRRVSAPFAGGRRDLARVARDLGATLLADGTVQAEGDAVRVSLTLVRADATVAWGRSVTGEVRRVLDLQRELADGLRAALRSSGLGASPAGGAAPPAPATLDPDALAEYSEALQRLTRQDLAGNLDLAIDGFTRALARDGGFVLAHVGLSDAYMARHRQTQSPDALAEAASHAGRATTLAPYHAEAWVALARVHTGSGRDADARAALERALSLQPANDEAWRELALARAAGGDRAGAEQAFRRAIELRPGYWPNHHEFGRFLFETGRDAEAAEEFRAVIARQPDSPRGYQALGTVLQAQGHLAEALANYERATELSPSVNAHLNVGVLHHWAGRYREAVAAYEQAASLAPDDPVPPRNVGDSLLRAGDAAGARTAYARALGLTERALRQSPGALDLRELRAVLLAKLGRHAEAGREAAAVVAEGRGPETAHYTQAVVLALAGRTAEARAALDRALAAGYPRSLAERDDDLAEVVGAPQVRAAAEGATR